MLKILGNKVVYFIIFLCLLNGGAGYLYYNYLDPEAQLMADELEKTKSDVETKRAEVAKLKEEFVLLQSQLRSFKELEVRGFFSDQNRVAAQESFEKLRTISGLLKAKYDISEGVIVPDPLAVAANQVVLKSPVKVEMDSLDDVDVYSFLKFVQEKFPGSVDITKVKLDRTEVFNVAMLREIGGGIPKPLVKASVEFDWRTMAAKNKVTPDASSSDSSKPAQTAAAAPASGGQ